MQKLHTGITILLALGLGLFILLFSGCAPRRKAVSSPATPEIPAQFPPRPDLLMEDAAILVWQERRNAKEDIGLDENRILFYFNKLSAIHDWCRQNLTLHPELSYMEDLHAFPVADLHSITVGTKADFPFTEEWNRGNPLTGNAGLDAHLRKWSLKPVPERHSGDMTLYRLETEKWIHPAGLAKHLSMPAGIAFAEPLFATGDGNTITAQEEGGDWIFEFRLGYGDCPSGCIMHYAFRFSLHDNDTIRFLGTRGDPPPDR